MNDLSPVQGIDFAFYYIVGISCFFLFLITVLMIYFVFKYRRNKNPVSSDIRGHTGLELVWTVIPTIIALTMFYVGWHSYIKLRNVPPGAIEVDVTAMTYSWEFRYEKGGPVSRELLVVPKGKPIKLNLISTDTLHGFFVPAYRIKIDVLPNRTTYAWFYPDTLGEFDIQCTVYCGLGHSGMVAKIRVVDDKEYHEYIEQLYKAEEDEEQEDE